MVKINIQISEMRQGVIENETKWDKSGEPKVQIDQTWVIPLERNHLVRNELQTPSTLKYLSENLHSRNISATFIRTRSSAFRSSLLHPLSDLFSGFPPSPEKPPQISSSSPISIFRHKPLLALLFLYQQAWRFWPPAWPSMSLATRPR